MYHLFILGDRLLFKASALASGSGNMLIGNFDNRNGYLVVECHYVHPSQGSYSSSIYVIVKYGNIVVRKHHLGSSDSSNPLKFIATNDRNVYTNVMYDLNCAWFPIILDYHNFNFSFSIATLPSEATSY